MWWWSGSRRKAGVALAARLCRVVALVMLVVVATRPPFEWLAKDIVARPAGARLVAGTGFVDPAGHVLAAAATWDFVPAIAGLYVRRRWVWWALTGHGLWRDPAGRPAPRVARRPLGI